MLRGARFVLLIPLACLFVHLNAAADERLPAYLIRLPESVATVFIAETAAADFHRFDRVGDGIEYRGSRYMSIGQDGDGKQRASCSLIVRWNVDGSCESCTRNQRWNHASGGRYLPSFY